MKINDKSDSDDYKEIKVIDLEEIFKISMLTNNQVKQLENNILNKRIKSVLNEELNQKLCLYISKEFDA